ncbi:hypothetical protein DFH06DRAFT_1196108 [Mycena polygramma]|nr:hypothetical protein DFH06DRAFT_1196108 [Mycena polygramma]
MLRTAQSLLAVALRRVEDYRHQYDEAFASSGAMAVKNCILKPPAGAERMRFEIHSGAGGRGGEKWYMKANHSVEAVQESFISVAHDF